MFRMLMLIFNLQVFLAEERFERNKEKKMNDQSKRTIYKISDDVIEQKNDGSSMNTTKSTKNSSREKLVFKWFVNIFSPIKNNQISTTEDSIVKNSEKTKEIKKAKTKKQILEKPFELPLTANIGRSLSGLLQRFKRLRLEGNKNPSKLENIYMNKDARNNSNLENESSPKSFLRPIWPYLRKLFQRKSSFQKGLTTKEDIMATKNNNDGLNQLMNAFEHQEFFYKTTQQTDSFKGFVYERRQSQLLNKNNKPIHVHEIYHDIVSPPTLSSDSSSKDSKESTTLQTIDENPIYNDSVSFSEKMKAEETIGGCFSDNTPEFKMHSDEPDQKDIEKDVISDASVSDMVAFLTSNESSKNPLKDFLDAKDSTINLSEHALTPNSQFQENITMADNIHKCDSNLLCREASGENRMKEYSMNISCLKMISPKKDLSDLGIEKILNAESDQLHLSSRDGDTLEKHKETPKNTNQEEYEILKQPDSEICLTSASSMLSEDKPFDYTEKFLDQNKFENNYDQIQTVSQPDLYTTYTHFKNNKDHNNTKNFLYESFDDIKIEQDKIEDLQGSILKDDDSLNEFEELERYIERETSDIERNSGESEIKDGAIFENNPNLVPVVSFEEKIQISEIPFSQGTDDHTNSSTPIIEEIDSRICDDGSHIETEFVAQNSKDQQSRVFNVDIEEVDSDETLPLEDIQETAIVHQDDAIHREDEEKIEDFLLLDDDDYKSSVSYERNMFEDDMEKKFLDYENGARNIMNRKYPFSSKFSYSRSFITMDPIFEDSEEFCEQNQ